MAFLLKLVIVVLLMVTIGFSFMSIDQPITEFLLSAGGVQDVYRTEAPTQFIFATFSVVCCFWVVFIASIKRKFVSACMMRSRFAWIRNSAISLYHFFDLEFKRDFGIITVILTIFWTLGRISGIDYAVFVMFIAFLAKIITLTIIIVAGCGIVSLLFYERTKKPKKTWMQPEITPEVVADLYRKRERR